MATRPADTKRQKISKAQQLTMLEVLGASLVLGTCLVLSWFLMKNIGFNAKVLTAKNEAITEYDQTIRNIGICVDKDKNGRLSDEEIKACNPDAVELSQVAGSLRYNILDTMAANTDLESVARNRAANCYDSDTGERIDFNSMYNEALNDTEREQALQGMKVCSALRVISDALPASKNTEALMASLNQVFIVSDWEPEVLAPRDDVYKSAIEGIEIIPVTMRFEGDGPVVIRVLDNLERSIREVNFLSATAEWTSGGISLQARANSYYLSEENNLEITKTVWAKGRK